MTPLSPPTLPIWMLERFLPSDERDALIGDLIEQHARGRSAGWFWRQAAGALCQQLVREVRSEDFEMVRMTAFTFVLMWALFEAFYLGVCAAGAVVPPVPLAAFRTPPPPLNRGGLIAVYLAFYVGGTL